jgi:hypothetical protein
MAVYFGNKLALANGISDVSLALKANINSPTFTGTPAAPTADAGTSTTQLATTAFVTGAIGTVNTALTGKQAVPIYVTTLVGGAVTVADNTIYTFTGVTSMAVTFPASNYHCLIHITTGLAPTITFPAGTKYLGAIPVFEANKEYEISIRNGIVGAIEVVS